MDIYQGILTERLAAKARYKTTGNKEDKAASDALKIILNAVYGKFGDKTSVFYNPKLMMTITLNCQLRFMQFVEAAILRGIEILLVNTDGAYFFTHSQDELNTIDAIAKDWQAQTGYTMSREQYRIAVIKDSNHHLTQTVSGKIKTKGTPFNCDYTESLIGGGTTPIIIAKAIAKYFTEAVPVEQTITARATGAHIEEFTMFSKRDQYIAGPVGYQPKVNRFVWAKDGQDLLCKTEKIPASTVERSVALANSINDFCCNHIDALDVERYIQTAKDEVTAIETGRSAGQVENARLMTAKTAERVAIREIKEIEHQLEKEIKQLQKELKKAVKAGGGLFDEC